MKRTSLGHVYASKVVFCSTVNARATTDGKGWTGRLFLRSLEIDISKEQGPSQEVRYTIHTQIGAHHNIAALPIP